MKTPFLISAIAACALSTPIAFAQTAPAKPAMSMDDKQVAATDENMKKMQQQMEKIGTTTDPKERQKLMQVHMQTMQENMKAMRAMGDPMAMDDKKGGGKMGGMMGGKKGATKDGDMKDRQEMTEKRMDMMQMMMEQMMKRDQAMQPMPHM